MCVCVRACVCASVHLKTPVLVVNGHSYGTNCGYRLQKIILRSRLNVLDCFNGRVDSFVFSESTVPLLKKSIKA